MDKGTIIRSVVLALALLNQVLVIFGKSPLPFSQEEMEQGISVLFTVITSLVAWFKNNYVTDKGRKQKSVLGDNGLL
ncbi:phage holin [Virgibacillus siamensis]|uniref:phage holin n=1 Tax=Virgibacillus siamensis TaxID=480071 RepID=UPI000986928C|nr:phage holin [Virgibacillus siamensis]